MSAAARLIALVPLALAGALALPAVQEAPAAATLERFVGHEGRPAHLSFDPAARLLRVVGEADRPLLFVPGESEGTDLWWTTLGELAHVPELEFLLREQARRASVDPTREVTELPERYARSEDHALVPVRLGRFVTARVNTNPGDLDPDDPAHFRTLTSATGVRAYLLVGPTGRLDLLVSQASLDGRWFEGEAEGDGTPARTGGLRLDLVFEAQLDLLAPQTLEWLVRADRESLPVRPFRVPREF